MISASIIVAIAIAAGSLLNRWLHPKTSKQGTETAEQKMYFEALQPVSLFYGADNDSTPVTVSAEATSPGFEIKALSLEASPGQKRGSIAVNQMMVNSPGGIQSMNSRIQKSHAAGYNDFMLQLQRPTGAMDNYYQRQMLERAGYANPSHSRSFLEVDSLR